MREKVMVRLNDITEKATIDQIKYWCKLLEIQPVIVARAAHVSSDQAEIISKVAKMVENGIRPRDAISKLVNTAVTVSPEPVNETNSEVSKRIEALENAVMLLVEQNKMLRTTIEAQNAIQTKKLEAIQLRLEPPKKEVKPIKPWEPAPKRQPQFSFLQRFWYELVDPVKLRAI